MAADHSWCMLTFTGAERVGLLENFVLFNYSVRHNNLVGVRPFHRDFSLDRKDYSV
jgi:hypothetical protein